MIKKTYKILIKIANAVLLGVVGGFLLILILSMFTLPNSIVIPNLPKYKARDNSQGRFPAIVKLAKNGKAFCTAFVIDNNYAMTAAHCIQGTIGLSDNIEILLDNNSDTFAIGKGVGTSDRNDVGLILGDFSNFNSLSIDFYDLNFYYPPQKLAACGFPYTQNKLTCSDFFPINNYGFSIRGLGHLIPGMSGGPVLRDGVVIGVNSAMMESGALVAPVAGSLGMFHIE